MQAQRPKRLNKWIRAKAEELLVSNFKIDKIIGVVIDWNEKKKKYDVEISPHKPCILAMPIDQTIEDPVYHRVHLEDLDEFEDLLDIAGAAQLAWMAIMGTLYPGLDLEHPCHTHHCINVYHHNPASRSTNIHRKADKKRPDQLKERDQRGRFVSNKAKTHIPATCDCDPVCIYNIAQNDSSDWNSKEKKTIFSGILGKSLHHVKLHPFL